MGFVVWEISGHFGGVYQSRYCASDGAFLFSLAYVMYLNIASYLCGKQIKSTLGNTMCLWMIFFCVHLTMSAVPGPLTDLMCGITVYYFSTLFVIISSILLNYVKFYSEITRKYSYINMLLSKVSHCICMIWKSVHLFYIAPFLYRKQ